MVRADLLTGPSFVLFLEKYLEHVVHIGGCLGNCLEAS